MKKFSFLTIFSLLFGFGFELSGSGQSLRIPGSSLIRKYHGEKSEKETSDNLICPYDSARALVSVLCGVPLETSQGQHVNIRLENTTVHAYNILRCVRQVCFVDPLQIEGVNPKDAYCITLNKLSFKNFGQIGKVLNTLGIAQNSVVVLDARDNELESIQKEDLKDFTNLQALLIDNNNITTFPPEALANTKIAILTMENNRLSKVKGLVELFLEKYKNFPVFFNFSNNMVSQEGYKEIKKIYLVYQATEENFEAIKFLSNSQTSCMYAIWTKSFKKSNLLTKRIYLGAIAADKELIALVRDNK